MAQCPFSILHRYLRDLTCLGRRTKRWGGTTARLCKPLPDTRLRVSRLTGAVWLLEASPLAIVQEGSMCGSLVVEAPGLSVRSPMPPTQPVLRMSDGVPMRRTSWCLALVISRSKCGTFGQIQARVKLWQLLRITLLLSLVLSGTGRILQSWLVGERTTRWPNGTLQWREIKSPRQPPTKEESSVDFRHSFCSSTRA